MTGGATAAILPCVSYQCASNLIAIAVSSNVFELVGISPENIVGKRSLWGDRLFEEDRDRLLSSLERLAYDEIGSVVHKVVNDAKSFTSVVHTFRKVKTSSDFTIQGCLVPLPGDAGSVSLSDAVIPQFIHKIGNHFQLINLLIGSLKRTGANIEEIEALQLTVDRAVEFTRAFSYYSQPPAFTAGVNLGAVLESVMESMTPWCLEKKVVLKHRIPRCMYGATMTADAYMLELAISALVRNALEATRGGQRIVLSATKLKGGLGGKSLARVAVVDNGSGMQNELLATATQPFVTSKRDRDGLGLSTACRVIECHGGQLKLSSTSGKGTKVEITLPVSFSPEAPTAWSENS